MAIAAASGIALDYEDYTPPEAWTADSSILRITPSEKINDSDWAMSPFILGDEKYDIANPIDLHKRTWSNVNRKFTDTRMGGNIGINARPQFNRYSDIRYKGMLHNERNDVTVTNDGGHYGMGRYYSEAIDDNSQTVYLRFGVPQFNSLFNFFSVAFDHNTSRLARTGYGASNMYYIAIALFAFAELEAFMVLSTLYLGGALIGTLFNRANSKFFTVKPTMPLYWSAVGLLLNTMAVNLGIIPRIMMAKGSYGVTDNPFSIDKEFFDDLQVKMPDVFNTGYGLEVYAIANRAQRLSNRFDMSVFDSLNTTGSSASDWRRFLNEPTSVIAPVDDSVSHHLVDIVNNFLKFSYYFDANDGKTAETDKVAIKPTIDPATGKPIENPDRRSFANFIDAEFRDGADFAVFKVDHTGSINESFSNSSGESDLAAKFNSMASAGREARFTFAGGNITDNAVGKAIQGAIGVATEAVESAASLFTVGLSDVLIGLTGAGYIDIPHEWQSSSAKLPSASYSMTLISPYGNVMSRLQNIFLPLAMLMAGALPRSTGKQSYTSPFLVQVFDKGRCQIQTGIIDSLSITRGTSNLPFTNMGQVLAIDVTFSVTDLSSIMHMPISTGSLFGANVATDEDNILMDYLAVLGGQDIRSQMYTVPRAWRQAAKVLRGLDHLTSPSAYATFIGNMTPFHFLSSFSGVIDTGPRQ